MKKVFLGISIVPILLIILILLSRKTLGNEDISTFLSVYVLPLFAISIICVATAYLNKNIQTYGIIIGLSAISGAYIFEIFLISKRLNPPILVEETAKRFGNRLDARSLRQVVQDNIASGYDVLPMFRLINDRPPDMPFVQLGLVPMKKIIICNEMGQYLIVDTDRHGFNNPNQIWDVASVDTIIVGDSFTFGNCVPKGKGYSDLLRNSTPLLANLGVPGNGPLVNFAILVEYIAHLQPKNIIWMHYLNDLANLEQHLVTELASYLEKGWNQNLINEAQKVRRYFSESKWISNFIERTYLIDEENRKGGDLTAFINEIIFNKKEFLNLLKLSDLRRSLGLISYRGRELPWTTFALVLARAEEIANEVGAEIHYVYLPSLDESSYNMNWLGDRVLDIARNTRMKTYDLRDVFGKGDVSEFYAFGRGGGHYTPKGNAVIARYLGEHVIKRTPLQSN